MSDWRFLDEWFRVLKGDVAIYKPIQYASGYDAVRLGFDGGSDALWIDVSITHSMSANDDAQRTARCHALHEALVLTSLLAVADYGAWRDALSSISELSVPATVDPDAWPRRLQPQYRLAVMNATWGDIKNLFSSEIRSDRFHEHFALATETARRQGKQLDSVARFPVMVSDCPMSNRPSAPTDRPRQVAAVLNEILALVETGVCIRSLGLPMNFPDDDIADDAARFEAWALSMCAVCGKPQRATRRPVCVEQLFLEPAYDFPEMTLQLFSVLGEARSLRSLKMSASSLRPDPHGFFWLWLGTTLFRSDSHCAVEVLNLELISLTAPAVANLRDAMDALDPLALLWQKTTQPDTNASAVATVRRAIVVPTGSSVRPGVVVHDDAAKATVDALLFGIGFREVERALVSNKRQRVDPQVTPGDTAVKSNAHKIRTLFLGLYRGRDRAGSGAPAATCHVDELQDLVGAPLEALCLGDSDVDDTRLESCLAKCPRLQSLRLSECRLTLMDAIAQTYERGGQMFSLDLEALEVSPAFLPPFRRLSGCVAHAERHEANAQAASHWPPLGGIVSPVDCGRDQKSAGRPADARVFAFVPKRERDVPQIQWDVDGHGGEILPVPGVPPVAFRVAFASVIRHFRTREQFARLDYDAVATVLEFIGTTKQRVATTEANIMYRRHPQD